MRERTQTGFIAGFNQAAKEPIHFPRYPYVDEIPTFLSWPFVWALARTTSVGPEFIALTGLVARLAVAWTIAFALDDQRVVIIALLIYAILSDCADGQMARYRRSVSSLGALYDLSSDFIGSLAIFMALCGALSRGSGEGARSFLLGALALLCYFCSCSAWAYVRMRQGAAARSGAEQAELFLTPPANDGGEAGHYQAKFRFLRAFFVMTWLPFARLTLTLPIWKDRVRFDSMLHVHALGSLNVHWAALVIILWQRWSIATFFVFELLSFLGLVLWIRMTEVQLIEVQPTEVQPSTSSPDSDS